MSMRASAARYARALLDVANKESDPERAEQELAAFVDLVRTNPDLERTLANPVVSAADKRAIVQQILERLEPTTPVGKLVLLLASRGRLALLPALLDVYRERLMEYRNVLSAEVTTAAPLSPERAEQLQRGHSNRRHGVRRQRGDAARQSPRSARTAIAAEAVTPPTGIVWISEQKKSPRSFATKSAATLSRSTSPKSEA